MVLFKEGAAVVALAVLLAQPSVFIRVLPVRLVDRLFMLTVLPR